MAARRLSFGKRMDRAVRRFPYGRVAIIGCDIPDANAADLRAAFKPPGHIIP